MISTTPLPQQSQLTIPSGEASTCGHFGFRTNPLIEWRKLTCVLSDMHHVQSAHNHNPLCCTGSEMKCLRIAVKLCDGNDALVLQTAFILEVVTLPARYLYHNFELLWSCVLPLPFP